MRGLLRRIVPADAPFYPFPIDYSCKFKRVDGDNIYRTYPATPLRTDQYKGTARALVKRGSGLGAYSAILTCIYDTNNYSWIYFDTATDKLRLTMVSGAAAYMALTSDAVFRDTSHWYDIHVSIDATLATAADRVTVTVNGVPITMTGTTIPQNNGFGSWTVQTYSTLIGDYGTSYGYELDGYVADVHVFDGTVVPATEFGEFINNTWVPKEFTNAVTYPYGNLGFHLDFADSGDLGNDVSGNGNHLSSETGTPTQTADTPTNNFPTFDPSQRTLYTVSEAGLKLTTTNVNYQAQPLTTIIPKTGKWQIEGKIKTAVGRGVCGVVDTIEQDFYNDTAISAHCWGIFGYDGFFWDAGSGSAYGSTFQSIDDVVGIVYDADAKTLTFYINGVSQGVAKTFTEDYDLSFYFGDGSTSYAETWVLNNGAEGFDYPVTGALPICTENWPAPEILDSEEGLWIPTWTGDGTASRNITGCPFDLSSDEALVWMKNRDDTANHKLVDTVRGVGNILESNTTSATRSQSDVLSAFLSNGFTIGDNAGANANTDDLIAWVFNMLPKYGMDIVTYTGDAVDNRQLAHNLGAAPELGFVKSLDDAYNWNVICEYLTSWSHSLRLNLTNVQTNSPDLLNGVAPTSTYINLANELAVNKLNSRYVFYLFRSIPGFLKVGYYIGNGSADGPRIYTDFRVRYLLVKASGRTSGWFIKDTARSPYNVIGENLYANASDAENTHNEIDVLSNGWKIRTNDSTQNASGDRYIYLAIGDAFPYVNAF
jgi:hypothetical protein